LFKVLRPYPSRLEYLRGSPQPKRCIAVIEIVVQNGTVEFSSEITIPLSFTAECAENADALENPSVDWNALKLCAPGDLRGDKSLGF